MRPDRAVRTVPKLTLAAALLATAYFLAAPASAEPQCIASFREIKFPDGSARLKNYVCKTEGAAKPEIRVEFNRLSEAAAGSLIMGTASPDMDRAFGKVRLIDNAVAAEARKIFDNFGIKGTGAHCFGFQVSTAGGGQRSDTPFWNPCEETRTLWYLTFPDSKDITVGMPLVSDAELIQTTTNWPEGYNFHYSFADECSRGPINCVTIWRPARQDDLANYERDMAAYDKAVQLAPDVAEESDLSAPAEAETSSEDSFEWDRSRTRYFRLVEYLTQRGWPDDFLIITGVPDDCAEAFEFNLHVRKLLLDTAFIKNMSDDPLNIEALLGAEIGDAALRRSGDAAPARAEEIALAERQLQPGETIAIPLAISFIMADTLEEYLGDQPGAVKAYKKVQSAKPGTVFQSDDAWTGLTIRKLRESFGPPTQPDVAAYVFGPEIRLSGLSVRGQQVLFDQASRNFVRLMADEASGSCPYLYAWDDGRQTWLHHGKVIHEANGKDKEMTESRTFPGFRSKFRLAEEELEVSYIDHVELEVVLKGGAGMTLRPDFAAMATQDATYATIKAGDRIEFSFALPPNVKPADVKQSTLAITGYYRRYSSLLMARQ